MKKISFNQNWTCNGAAVQLPHDAMIHEKRVPGHASGSAQAFFPGGRYVYEKTFEKPNAEHVVFQFEGVYKNAKVYINGKEAGGAPYGYIPFFVCADELLAEGENTIRVECENNDQPESRWYTGAGIYRPVWLWTGCKNAIVLQHDSHWFSVDAVEKIIVWGMMNGYTFQPITADSPGAHHGVYN